MGIIELLIIAVGVSMDAFAVSVCKGLSCPEKPKKTALLCGIWFGLFQMIMPIIGYLIGSVFESMIERFDHWIAFILLLFIGGKMLLEALSKKDLPLENDEEDKNDLSISKMLLLAIATSIDALAVGVTFAMVETNIFVAISLIGIFTFTLSFVGALIGKHFGEKHRKIATFLGGLVIVLIGVKILIEHLFF